MNTRVSASNLVQAMKDLSAEWQQAKESWRDAKAREFEERYLDPLPGYIARATAVMEEVETLMRKVRKDCE
jgi:hypothetical protein